MGSIRHLSNAVASPIARSFLSDALKNGIFLSVALATLCVGLSKKGMEITRLVAEKKMLDRLRKEYGQALKDSSADIEREFKQSTVTRNKTIWAFWGAGEENAPALSRQCFASARKHMPDYELVVLDDATLVEYIKLPDSIMEKYQSGAISPTHFSDIVRIELLTKYGGIWVDATVLFTNALPEVIAESDLFTYQILKPGLDGHSVAISSWFMVANRPSRILLTTKRMLQEYWLRNSKQCDYFLLHYFFQLAIEMHPDEWMNVIPYSSEIPHVLLLRLFDQCDESVLTGVLNQTSIHKLSNKLEWPDGSLRGTYYEALLKGFNGCV